MKFSKLALIYLISGGVMLGGFTYLSATGYKVFTPTGKSYHRVRAPFLIYHK